MPHKRRLRENPFEWDASTVNKLLKHREYIGDVINCKTYRKSYKNHKTYKNPEENQLVFEGVNEPIISVDVWNKAQDLIEKGRRIPYEKEPDLFQGYLVCADCGSKLYARSVKGKKDHYMCSGYAKKHKVCSTHRIRSENLYELVLTNLREIIFSANLDKKQFAESLRKKSETDNKSEMKKIVKETEKMKSRTASPNKIIHKLFEDRVDGKIS
ncbi:MAG: recombinase family protein [Ruminococcus sp.]|nr:recombinase family protein [Ruminococcus sp.]MCM1380498.1 recombinase family protein [Muribaculaceae bacterium]MCM1478886.1 recombinase family protein [Muribaculaceae bacterium]